MSAENSISNYSHQNLKSILEGAKNNNLNGGNLLVYIDSRQTTPYLYKIKQNSNGTTETEVIEQYEEQNSADPTVMSSVINTVLRKYPSASYGLFLWSHGTAWLPGDLSDYTTRAFGEDSGKHMEINTLKETLPSGIFDFIIFDACYMASVEVTYALKEKADYILASPTEVLGNGMPYEEIIQPLFATNLSVSEMLEKIGRLFFTFYKEQKKGNYYPISASISLVDTHALDALATACKTILSGEFETMYELPKKISSLWITLNIIHGCYMI
ncbi:MAG: clostripain-related cysteine peptidase [Tannerellaceae bacterium]|nr:clostripain-related cysteine peptidase [Tannerellaceae bacterium]